MAALPPRLMPHWKAPHRAGEAPGELARGAASARADNQACGDELEIWIVHAGARIQRCGFSGRGCSAVIATASLACSEIEGLEVDGALESWSVARTELAPQLGRSRQHALDLVERALALALAQVRARCHPGLESDGSVGAE